MHLNAHELGKLGPCSLANCLDPRAAFAKHDRALRRPRYQYLLVDFE